MLFHAEGHDDLRLRLNELTPELLILDANCEPCRDLDQLHASLTADRARTLRPQVLLLTNSDDPLREELALRVSADVINDLPIDDLELSVEVRTLVRVRSVTSQALGDRDVLNHLLELSTFSTRYQSREEVLVALASRVAQWLSMPHVVVTLGSAKQPQIAAECHVNSALGSGRTLVERRHAELLHRGVTLMIDPAEGVLSGDDPSTLPYVGVPLCARNGVVLGALHGWGGALLPNGPDMAVLRMVAERISTEIQLYDSNRRLEEMVESRTADLTALLERLRAVNNQLLESSRDTVMRLARAAEYRDGDTGDHVARMANYAQSIAKQLGMTPEEQALIKLAAPMHDVGKIGIPDAILLKAGKLTEEEFDIMKEHPTIGARILAGSRSKLLQMAESIAESHHEHWDGSGYPKGLRGNDIPLVGRIVALADVFDALTSPRVYKDAWDVDQAVSHIQSLTGKQFDPRVVDAFEQCLDDLLETRSLFSDESEQAPFSSPQYAPQEGVS